MTTPTPTAILLILTAAAGEKTQKPEPQQTSHIESDPVWGRPLNYLDFVLYQAAGKLRPTIEYLSTRPDNGLFVLDTPASLPGRVFPSVDPKTNRAILGISFTVKKTLQPPKDICGFFFKQAAHQLAANAEPEGRDNVLWGLLPPSAHVLPQEEVSKANERLMGQLDLMVKVYEVESRKSFSCRKPILANDFTVFTEGPRQTGKSPTKD